MRVVKLEKNGCGPCQAVQNYLDAKGIQAEKIEVFENPELAAQFDIATVPVVVVLDDLGNEVARAVGFNRTQLDLLVSVLTA